MKNSPECLRRPEAWNSKASSSSFYEADCNNPHASPGIQPTPATGGLAVDKRAPHLKTGAMSSFASSQARCDERPQRLLAIDFGERRTGTALVDLELGIATPLQTLTRRSDTQLIAELESLRQRHRAGGWLLGLPLRLDGTEGDAGRRIRSFGTKLVEASALDPIFVSETLTSDEARRRLGSTARRCPEKIDAVAAQILGEQYLSEQATTVAEGGSA